MTLAGRPPGRHPGRALRLALLAALAATLAGAHPAPATLHGPLSDFWVRVKSDWSRRLPGLNHSDTQTFLWVSMVWEGPDELEVEDLASELQTRESRRWVRAQITRHRWSEIADRDLSRMLAMRQHLILLGTPEDNPLVARALQGVPLRVRENEVEIGSRRLRGEGLLVVAIVPSPLSPSHYAMVITGSSRAAVMQVLEAAYGDTDFAVFRGRRLVARGAFQWNDGATDPKRLGATETFTERFDYESADSAHLRLRYDPKRMRQDAALLLGRRLDVEIGQAAAFYGIPADRIAPIDLYLYPSVDEKLHQTGDARPVHRDRVERSLHAIAAPGGDGIAGETAWLAASLLLERDSPAWGPAGARELPGFFEALSLAHKETFEGIPLASWASASSRDAEWLPMDRLMYRPLGPPEPGDLSALDAAAFARDLILREGAMKVSEFYRTARRSDFRERFRELFGRSLAHAEKEWLSRIGRRRLDPLAAEPSAVIPDESRPGGGAGPGSAVARAAELFRSGRFEQAAAAARDALRAAGHAPEGRRQADPHASDRAWARLTLGRIHALAGRLVAASAELTSEEIRRGPEQVQVLASYWLETLGQPLNRKAAHEALRQEAEADLLNFDWDAAEAKLRQVLAGDPLDKDAHLSLGRVYLSRYQYWYDYSLLDLELFPGISQADPESFLYLAQKGQRELRIAEAGPKGVEDELLPRLGAGDPAAEDPLPHFLMARVHLSQRKYDAARRELEQALDLRPRDRNLEAACQIYLARIESAQGRPQEARRRLELAIRSRASARMIEMAREDLGKLTKDAE